eukprot:8912552-Karenia_brevis.AAC.1
MCGAGIDAAYGQSLLSQLSEGSVCSPIHSSSTRPQRPLFDTEEVPVNHNVEPLPAGWCNP